MKLVIFDCDGTLIDSQHAIVEAINEVFDAAGLAVPTRDDVMAIIGLSLPEAFATLVPDADEALRSRLGAQYRAAFTRHRESQARQEPLYPGIRDVIEHLGKSDDTALAIATGKSRAGVHRLLAREAWDCYFDSIQTADMNPSKPHPGMVFSALQDVGAMADQAVMIGDTTFDMEMARAASIGALGVAWGYHPVAALKQAGAHHITASASTLLGDIDRLLTERTAVVD